MSCKAYKNALTETAGSGLDPRVDLQIHLRECPACHAEFTQAKLLFAAIDRGIQSRVNEQPSASFLSVVKTEVPPNRVTSLPWIQNLSWQSLALASVAILFAIAATVIHRETPEAQQIRRVAAASQTALPPLPSTDTRNVREVSKQKKNRAAVKLVSNVISQNEEVIFSAEEQKNYRALITNLQHKRSRSVVLPSAPLSGEDKSLELKPVQIASLEIKPLAQGDN